MTDRNRQQSRLGLVFRQERELALALVTLGLTSIVTQIILLREFLSIFYGNELVIGILFANWMMLTGAGALLGKYSARMMARTGLVIFALCLIAFLPGCTVFLLRYLRNIIFTVGGMVGLLQILYASFFLMMPYCLLSGFFFTLLARMISDRIGSNLIPLAYSVESFGSILGGLLASLLMVYLLTTFQSLMVLAVIGCLAAFLLSVRYSRTAVHFLLLSLTALAFLSLWLLNLDDPTKGFLFPGQQVRYSRDTPYGSLTVTQEADQTNYYENNVLLYSTNDATQNEEAVHYAMIQTAHPKNVLVVSGGLSGILTEVLKYDVDRVDYVELNPWIIAVGRYFTPELRDERIHVIHEDARRYVRFAPVRYDAALVNLPDPATTQINRYSTLEFLRDLKPKLNPGGVVSFSLLQAQEYVSGDAATINSIMVKTLSREFQHVLIVPGSKNYFLVSDNPLDIHIASLVERRGIPTLYVNKYYIDDELLSQRSSQIQASLTPDVPLNTDFEPVSYYRQLLYWLRYFRSEVWIAGALCLIAILLAGRKLNPVSFGIFTGGFAASSVELLLLMAFQIIYGYLYQMIGLIITCFMAGLAAGALYRDFLLPEASVKNYVRVQFCIGGLSVILPLVFLLLQQVELPGAIVITAFSFLSFGVAVAIGMEFSLAVSIRSGGVGSVVSELYSADLFGSALGSLLTAALLIPWLGIVRVGLLTGVLSILSGFLLFVRGGKLRDSLVVPTAV